MRVSGEESVGAVERRLHRHADMNFKIHNVSLTCLSRPQQRKTSKTSASHWSRTLEQRSTDEVGDVGGP